MGSFINKKSGKIINYNPYQPNINYHQQFRCRVKKADYSKTLLLKLRVSFYALSLASTQP